MKNSIGIDLGTSRCVAAYINEHGEPGIIRNEYGNITTPSLIGFKGERLLIGDEADKLREEGDEVASLFKRHMGEELTVFSKGNRHYTPVDLSTLMLLYMKKQAERYLGEPVSEAVITVPAYFADPQRQATIAAGINAGLRILKIINEPTAAALAYCHQTHLKPAGQLLLVYDLGGGTFDVSLMQISSSALNATELNVIDIDGNHRLGGADWDERLLAYVLQQFEEEFNVKVTRQERHRYLFLAEQAKQALSARQRAAIRIMAQNQSRMYSITRLQFETCTHSLVEQTRMLTERLLRKNAIAWSDITTVLLVGGATRMPMIRAAVEQMSGKTPVTVYNPDEIVAVGAALQAGREARQAINTDESAPVVIDATAHSLGMIAESADRSQYVNSIIIPKGTPIPAAQTRSYQLRVRYDGKTTLEAYLTQGENTDPRYCLYLGRYVFSAFPRLIGQKATINITYQYDENGIVHISAIEQSTGQPLKLIIDKQTVRDTTRFTKQPMRRVRKDPLTIYLAFDLSGSMKDEPLAKAKSASLSFVEQCNLATTAVGLLSFADHVRHDIQATHDKQAIIQAIEQLAPGRVTGYSNNTDPFDDLYSLLSDFWHQRYAVVLTDGAWSRPALAIEKARRCKEAGIEIFAVGFGEVDQSFLAQIASSAEMGMLVDMNQLVEAFSAIAQEIGETGEAEFLRET